MTAETKALRHLNLDTFAEAQNRLRSAEMTKVARPFLLLLGPSAVGKSEIIHHLTSTSRYVYVSPYTTRKLRPGETEKIHVDRAEFERMQASHEFVAVNPLYGELYGTPMGTITQAIEHHQVPLLDYPLNGLNRLALPPSIQPICVYVLPPNIQTWYERMSGASRVSMSRLRRGFEELVDVIQQPNDHSNIVRFVVNGDHQSHIAAEHINSVMQEILVWDKATKD